MTNTSVKVELLSDYKMVLNVVKLAEDNFSAMLTMFGEQKNNYAFITRLSAPTINDLYVKLATIGALGLFDSVDVAPIGTLFDSNAKEIATIDWDIIAEQSEFQLADMVANYLPDLAQATVFDNNESDWHIDDEQFNINVLPGNKTLH